MKVETKYEIGDVVFVVREDCIEVFKIGTIYIYATDCNKTIHYSSTGTHFNAIEEMLTKTYHEAMAIFEKNIKERAERMEKEAQKLREQK